MKGSFLGPEYTNDEIKIELDKIGASYDFFQQNELENKVSDLLIEKKLIQPIYLS